LGYDSPTGSKRSSHGRAGHAVGAPGQHWKESHHDYTRTDTGARRHARRIATAGPRGRPQAPQRGGQPLCRSSATESFAT
jgi:hypothetical protein